MDPTNDPTTPAFWDARAAEFDDDADHGLRDAEVRQAWADVLDEALVDVEGTVVDLGCGTGSLSLLLAARGHRVVGIDASAGMIEQARAKAREASADISFIVGDVAMVAAPADQLAGIVCRHLLWAVGDPAAVIARWSERLAPDSSFVAIEGVWNGAGLRSSTLVSMLDDHFRSVTLTDLASHDALWGKRVTDHRYLAIAQHPT